MKCDLIVIYINGTYKCNATVDGVIFPVAVDKNWTWLRMDFSTFNLTTSTRVNKGTVILTLWTNSPREGELGIWEPGREQTETTLEKVRYFTRVGTSRQSERLT